PPCSKTQPAASTPHSPRTRPTRTRTRSPMTRPTDRVAVRVAVTEIKNDEGRVACQLSGLVIEGAPPGTRTPNPRIKSLSLLLSRVHLCRILVSPRQSQGIVAGQPTSDFPMEGVGQPPRRSVPHRHAGSVTFPNIRAVGEQLGSPLSTCGRL